MASAALLLPFLLVVCTSSGGLTSGGPGYGGYDPIDPRWMRTYSIVEVPGGRPQVVKGDKPTRGGAAATAHYGTRQDNQGMQGWNYLHLTSNSSVPDKTQAYMSGYLEGYLTSDLIHQFWRNNLEGLCLGSAQQARFCSRLKKYFEANDRWLKRQVKKYGGVDPYWHLVGLFYEQLRGMTDGFNAAMPAAGLKFQDFVWLNINGDMGDFMSAFDADESYREPFGSGSCSALIKHVIGNDGKSELFVTHDTWGSYTAMTRILKRYDLAYKMPGNGGEVPGASVSMSSYPALLSSVDDYYLTSAGLVVLETTIDNYNSSAWQFVQPQNALIAGVRTMVANRLSRSGAEWAKTFTKYNSGTYNNQWMVVDYKVFGSTSSLQDLQPGLLWVLEQMPGMVQSEDATNVLRTKSYWPSYNIAYFPGIFSYSEAPSMVQKYGDWFTYDRAPRALIFKRDQPGATTLESVVHLMRHNDYLHDPLAICDQCVPRHNAENAIPSRSDLNPASGKYPFPSMAHRSHGATDTKVTSMGLAAGMQFVAVNGPVYDPLPAFQWSKADFGNTTPHYGQPDLFKYQPVTVEWTK